MLSEPGLTPLVFSMKSEIHAEIGCHKFEARNPEFETKPLSAEKNSNLVGPKPWLLVFSTIVAAQGVVFKHFII
jgi:hypothetical protein